MNEKKKSSHRSITIRYYSSCHFEMQNSYYILRKSHWCGRNSLQFKKTVCCIFKYFHHIWLLNILDVCLYNRITTIDVGWCIQLFTDSSPLDYTKPYLTICAQKYLTISLLVSHILLFIYCAYASIILTSFKRPVYIFI